MQKAHFLLCTVNSLLISYTNPYKQQKQKFAEPEPHLFCGGDAEQELKLASRCGSVSNDYVHPHAVDFHK
jgi:hypothetical protein